MNEESAKSFQDSLFKALNLFNNHEWYEAHDAFEEIWNSVDGDERQVIQGILQVSVSQFHLSKGNLNGATILLGEGLGRIKTRTKINLGIDLLMYTSGTSSFRDKVFKREVTLNHQYPFDLGVIWSDPPRKMICLEPWTSPRNSFVDGFRNIMIPSKDSISLNASIQIKSLK